MRARRSAFYRLGLTTIRDKLGWAIENTGDTSDRAGECNNTSDILATTLLLGQPGEPVAYADSAQIVRGHMMPAQLWGPSLMRSSRDLWGDSGRATSATGWVACSGSPCVREHDGRREECVVQPRHRQRHDVVAGVRRDVDGTVVVALRVDHSSDVATVKVRQRDGRFDVEIKPEPAGDVRAAMPQWVAESVASLVGARRWETSADEA